MVSALEPILKILMRKYKRYLLAIKLDEYKERYKLHYSLSRRDSYISKLNEIEKDILKQYAKRYNRDAWSRAKDIWHPIRNGFLRSVDSDAQNKF